MMRYSCHYCDQKTDRITKDHIVPLSKGGADKPWNIVQSCFPCNSAKGNLWPTCSCVKCQRSIAKHGNEDWPAWKLRQIPLGTTVTLAHPKGSILVGRKAHSDIDDFVAVAGLGNFNLHKMKGMGWRITVESPSHATSTKAVQVPTT